MSTTTTEETGEPQPPPAPARGKVLQELGRLPLVGAVLVVLALLVALGNWRAGLSSRARIDAAGRVSSGSLRLLSTVKDVEIGERGLLLFRDEATLQPYTAAVGRIAPQLAVLDADRRLAGIPENSGEPRLADLVVAKQRLAADAIATYRASGVEAAKALFAAPAGQDNRDKQSMDAVRAGVARLQAVAEQRAARLARGSNARDDAATAISLILAIGACLLFAAYAFARRRHEKRAQALLDGVLENAPAGIGMLDRDGRFLRLNRMLGSLGEREVAPGASLWDLLGEPARVALEPRIGAVLSAGRVAPNMEVELSPEAPPDDRRQVQVSLYPLRDARRGGVEGIGLIGQDITRRKRAERRLRLSEQRFRTLLDATSSIIWTTAPDGTMEGEQVPWTRFTGQTADQLHGMGWLDCVHPEDRAETVARWTESLAAKTPLDLTHRLRRRDGEYRHMAVSAAPILDAEAGELREWVGSHSDITDRTEAEAALAEAKAAAEAANRAKSQFIANMSHELRTPLSAVIGYSEMLAEEIEDIGQTALLADVHKIETNARHLLGLINDVLDLSKIEADRMTMYAEDFSLDAMIDEVADAVGSLIERNHNTLDVVRTGALGEAHTDQTKLRQCLFNLLSNAAKFTENGRITLSARRETMDGVDWIEVSVRDEGIGMNEEQLSRLFQRFSQADASTTRQFGGTGLGLAITRAFSKKLGGDVGVTSAPGAGSTFVVRVPADLPGEPEEEDAKPAAETAQAAGHADTLLVVDDDPATRELLSRFLRRDGFAVETAADGREGLAAARRLRPRAVLLDVTMPHLDGWSVLHAIRSDPDIGATPVVMCTVLTEQSLGFSLGATDYLVKPIEWDELKRVVDRFRPNAPGDVLLVDDDADARARLRGMLARNGWTVAEAANGREALEKIQSATPGLILLDLMMPEMDGFAFLHQFRAMPGMHDIPVVVLSAKDITPQDRAELEPEADQIIRKGSMSMQDLAQTLRRLAAREGHKP